MVAARLGVVRRFALYCSCHDPRTRVPPPDLLPYPYRRVSPYIYCDQEILHLLKAARQLPSAVGLRPHTYATLFGLYAAAGLRTSEPLRLDRDDVDFVHGVLTVRDTKFGKSRYVPVHPSTQRVLQRYARRRDRLCPHPHSPSFFLSDQGRRLRVSSCVGRSSDCLARSACATPAIHEDLASTTCVIAWPLPHSPGGIGTASMSSAIYRSFLRTWDTPISRIRSGI